MSDRDSPSILLRPGPAARSPSPSTPNASRHLPLQTAAPRPEEESVAQRDSAGDAHSESESAAACHFEDGRQCLDRSGQGLVGLHSAKLLRASIASLAPRYTAVQHCGDGLMADRMCILERGYVSTVRAQHGGSGMMFCAP